MDDVLPSTAAIERDLAWRQQLVATFGEEKVDGETFSDRWRGGFLVERTVYAHAGGARAVVIRYQPTGKTQAPAGRVVLDNRAYGYRIEIETVALR